MNENQIILVIVKGIISDLPETQRNQVHATADKIRAIVAEAGDVGGIALALVGGEAAAAENA
jgi:hypothetical protein